MQCLLVRPITKKIGSTIDRQNALSDAIYIRYRRYTATQTKRTRSVVDTGTAYHNGRCTTQDDGVVGYWYAGADAPGQAGEVLVMDYSVNVRADYPDHHNAYDARATVRCQLAAGDKVRLTAPPIHVPGDAYWVPLYNGDLIKGDA